MFCKCFDHDTKLGKKQFTYLNLMCAVAETVSATETQSEWKFVMSKFPDLFAKDNYKIMFIWKRNLECNFWQRCLKLG